MKWLSAVGCQLFSYRAAGGYKSTCDNAILIHHHNQLVAFMFISDSSYLRAQPVQKTYTPGKVLPVLSPAKLLSAPSHVSLLKQLEALADINVDAYDRYFRAAIDRFSAFVQVMPTQPSGPLCSLLNEGLSRAYLAVKYYLASAQTVNPMLLYAVFSAALMVDLSRVMINHAVVLTDESGDYRGDWLPFTGSMVEQTDYYKLYQLGSVFQRLDNTLTPMLAQSLMPRDGFLWLSTDMVIFAEWLDVLRGDKVTGGQVSHILSLIPLDEWMEMVHGLVQVPIAQLDSPATEFGDLFLEWLKDGIASGEIDVNSPDAAVHIVADGVFLEQNKIFHQFAEATRLPVNRNVVFQQFGNLFGIASKGGYDFLNRQFFSQNQQAKSGSHVSFSAGMSQQRQLRSGVVVPNAGLVFKSGQPPVVSNALQGASKSGVAAAHQLPTSRSQQQPGQRRS